ncbi:translocation/assembly module TamB domain-containing protein [Dyadobacter tibetensis]|uniref:translocation/assembly module TamB domain-containing protein n=1 Tax=Dyadobacter tibetensis TaxID=1211851 RepID=UPI00046FCAC2|nr:translocation/assembly module TamB domain-containing protein [Dyadobacter tibetensis]
MVAFLKAFLNGLVVVIIFALLALGICTMALQFPSVQTRAVRYATNTISERLGYPVGIGRVNIKWFDVVSLEQVTVKDTSQLDMIDVGRIDVNLNLSKLIENSHRDIHLDEVNVYQPKVKLVVVPEAGMLNIDGFIERIAELTAPAVPRAPDAPENNIPFTIGKSLVTDGQLSYDDPREPRRMGSRTFDYSHFKLQQISGDLRDFLVQGDTISFRAKGLKSVDAQTGLDMRKLDTKFLFCQKKMELKELNAYIGDSHIRDEIVFYYNRSGELGDFNHKVFLKGRLRDSRISARDLGLFSTYVDGLHEHWMVSGLFDGKVDDFVFSRADIQFGKGSRLRGDLGFKGLPDLDAVHMDLDLQESIFIPEDIVQYYPDLPAHPTLAKFGGSTITGRYLGDLVDFSVKADVQSLLGKFVCDLQFHIVDDRETTYQGMLKTAGLDLGILLDDTKNYQKLDFSGNLKGKGLALAYVATHMEGQISRIGFQNYNYQNIKLNGKLQNQYFSGAVSARDSNFIFALNGEFDLSKEQNFFDVKGSVDRANLRELGYARDSIALSTRLDVQLKGNDIDALTGNARFYNTFLVHTGNKRNLVIDSLSLTSTITHQDRQINLNSEFLTAYLKGDFLPTQAWADLGRLLEEYKLYFFDTEASRKEYYARRPKLLQNKRYRIDYGVNTKDLSNFFAFLTPDLYLSKGASVAGSFRLDNTAFLTMTALADTLRYGNNQFFKSEIDLTTSKFTNGSEVLASMLVLSENQQISAMVPTEKMVFEGAWDVDHIDFNGGIKQVMSTNNADLKGEIRFLSDGLTVGFNDSKLNLLEEVWAVPSGSQLLFDGSDIVFKNLGLVSGKQRLALNGTITRNPSKTLTLEIKNFRLNALNPLFETRLSGIMDATANMRNVYQNMLLEAQTSIEGLGYGKYEFGNFVGAGDWDPVLAELLVDAKLSKNLKDAFNIKGVYRPFSDQNPLDLNANFNRFELKAIEPFAGGLVSDVSGLVKGNVRIKGRPTAPALEGSLAIEKGKMKFDYLQSVFTFSDQVNISEGEISVNNMVLTDPEGNTAVVRGGVFHDGFKYFSLGFNADLRGFKILNTTARDSETYYGTAYVTGPVSVYGSINKLNIEANATSNKGTKIYIPLDGATEVATQDYIQFISQLPSTEDSAVGQKDTALEKTLSGIKMDFNFNLTPDALCEIIFDRQTGDVISGVGSGRINMNIDTQGDFTMAGTYEIEKGSYNFTLQNVINKKFIIKPGSRIIWSGDPYGAQLDVKAGYVQPVSLIGVLPSNGSSNTNSDVLSRRYPVEVTIGLSDKLMAPQIKYDLKILDNPTLSSNNYQGYLEAFQNKLKTNEQELSRQVTSLLVLNQLQPETSLAAQSSGQGFLGNSISELVSNQISRWASEINENLEVGVTGLSLDQNALNNLQLRFSYRFLNDRFRVTRDGRISNGSVGGVTQYDAASLLGEWTLEYWLNRSGSVRVKAYNRNIQNSFYLNSFTTGGVSMQFSHSFNRFIPLPKPSGLDSLQKTFPDSIAEPTAGNRLNISKGGR